MGHMEQYPADTVEVYSYLETRKPGHEVVFFGLQYILRAYLERPLTRDDAQQFLKVYEQILGKPSDDVCKKIMALADLGYWPIEIKAAPEGAVLGHRNVLMTIRNTLPQFYWCVGFLESLLLKLWYPCTVASASRGYKQLVTRFAEKTCDNFDHVPFQVHDFGYRGVSSEESAMIAGASHLLNFLGSDTIVANYFLDTYYDAAGSPKGMSVPASEHSVMCSYGRDGEQKAFDRMLELYPTGIVSIVSDSYDYWKILSDWAPSRKERILKRAGKVVFRPDSGDQEKIICGDPEAIAGTPVSKGSLEMLWEIFGGSTNSKGYRILNPQVGLIYGDGMHFKRFETILQRMEQQGFASSNLVIGVGGLLLQNHSRDEFGFALKATRIVKADGSKVEIFKDPATDPGKKSKKGLMKLCRAADGTYFTEDQVDEAEESNGELVVVFRDGRTTKQYSLKEVRERLESVSLIPALA